MQSRVVVELVHLRTGRTLPLETKTVIGRSEAYYRYTDPAGHPERLGGAVADALSELDYVMIDDDHYISRVHGMIDPQHRLVTDLRATNGTWVNGRLVPRLGEHAAGHSVGHGDTLVVGTQWFRVHVRDVSLESHLSRIHGGRSALIVTDEHSARRTAAVKLRRHLTQRMGFDAWIADADIQECLFEAAQRGRDDGISLLALELDVEGDAVLQGGRRIPFERFVGYASSLAGRKVVLLEGRGDPTACERVFADLAGADMALVSAPREHGPADDAGDIGIDALEATIGADTNRLDFGWLEGYAGRLAVTFGARRRPSSSGVEHSLRVGSSAVRLG